MELKRKRKTKRVRKVDKQMTRGGEAIKAPTNLGLMN